MSIETIKSYLLSLGFAVDTSSYNKIQSVMKELDKKVEASTSGMTKNYIQAGSAVVSVLASITAATVTLVDKVGQADLSYQKFALRMYMSVDAAKKMKIAQDALGESLEDIAWNPELRGRMQALYGDQDIMRSKQPKDMESQMRYIRDIRFEFTRLKVEATYGLQQVGYYILQNLAGPIGASKWNLTRLNDWLRDNLPVWTKMIADFLTPFIQLGGSVWRVLKDIGEGLKAIWDVLPPLGKEIAIVGGVITAFFLSGPMGRAMIVISTLILLIDDFFAYIDGRKSSLVR